VLSCRSASSFLPSMPFSVDKTNRRNASTSVLTLPPTASTPGSLALASLAGLGTSPVGLASNVPLLSATIAIAAGEATEVWFVSDAEDTFSAWEELSTASSGLEELSTRAWRRWI